MDEALRHQTDALIRAIWGPETHAAGAVTPEGERKHQNRALADAIRAYLQSYLDDLDAAPPCNAMHGVKPSSPQDEEPPSRRPAPPRTRA